MSIVARLMASLRKEGFPTKFKSGASKEGGSGKLHRSCEEEKREFIRMHKHRGGQRNTLVIFLFSIIN